LFFFSAFKKNKKQSWFLKNCYFCYKNIKKKKKKIDYKEGTLLKLQVLILKMRPTIIIPANNMAIKGIIIFHFIVFTQ